MSLVFLKSADDKQDGRYNPNKPYRFSNYLTNPLTIPKNAQVAYVSSQFLVDGNGVPPDEPSWINNGQDELGMLNYNTSIRWPGEEQRKSGGWESILNNWTLSANEFGMDGDFSPTKYEVIPSESNVPQANFGYRSNYKSPDNKVQIESYQRFALDQYNLYFNCIRGNPEYLGSAWNGGGGATVPAGLNFTDKVDTKFRDDCRVKVIPSPNSNSRFINGNCYGYIVGVETNDGNARANVYSAGPNYYNTGFATTGLEFSPYDFGGSQGASAPLPAFNKGNYAMMASSVGMKKVIGDITPSTDPQQSNGGGHQQIGHLGSGGYIIWTASNIDQALANSHYTVANSTKEGFTGIAPQFIGLHSIPYMAHRGRELAISSGVSSDEANDFNIQLQNFLKVVDLNKSESPTQPFGGDARYLIGIDMQNEGSAPNVDLVARVRVLDTIEGSITKSFYRELGQSALGNQPGLSLQALSNGINTACVPAYTFDATANYSINTYNTDPARTPASLFFRFRWINKYQIDVEFTLAVQSYGGTYDNAQDIPYAPAEIASSSGGGGGGGAGIQREVRLTNETNGSIENIGDDTIDFFDSGGAGGPYNPNESYNIVFVAKEDSNAILVFNEFEFEQSTSLLYDRLGIQISDDGVIWTNIARDGFQVMNSPNSPEDSTDPNDRILIGGGTWDAPASNGGWVLPRDLSRFTALGGTPGITYDFGARYVKFKFISDGNPSELGWNIQLTSSAPLTPENDPRDRWCLLASMFLDDIRGETDYIIPGYMGDMGIVQYPVASSSEQRNFRSMVKGYFDPKLTNRCFLSNNNGGGKQYSPYSNDNPYFAGIDTLGPLAYNDSNPFDSELTSQALINSDYEGEQLLQFNAEGFLGTDITWLGNPLQDPESIQSFRRTNGLTAWQIRQPKIELAYIFGFAKTNTPQIPIVIPVDPAVANEGRNFLLSANDIDATNEAFSNHIQLSNLPIISSNGVVSSICKTIYVVNSLCIHDTHDDAQYRYYCHDAPYPLWIDLNNLEEIQLNKFDVLITQDNNTEQRVLMGESQVVIMFRSKSEGGLPNTIPYKSISTTRTY